MTILIYRENKKGITPVIAIVMLMLITVGVVGVSYSWFSGLFSSQTKKFISIPAGGAYCSGGEIKVYVLNNGGTTLRSTDIIVADVDGIDGMNNGLVGYWKFDDGSGTSATDSSGNGNAGTLTNMNPLSVWVDGIIGKALDFDGDNDYVSLPTSTRVSMSNGITISTWVKTTTKGTVNNARNVFGASVGSPHIGYNLVIDINGKINFGANSLGTGVFGLTGVTDVTDGSWHHIAAVWDGTTTPNGVKMFLDSKLENSATATGTIGSTNAGPCIGNFPASDGTCAYAGADGRFKGAEDDVRLYSRALSQTEIKSLYGIKPGDSSMVINYPATPGRHAIKVGTSSGIAEASVTCV